MPYTHRIECIDGITSVAQTGRHILASEGNKSVTDPEHLVFEDGSPVSSRYKSLLLHTPLQNAKTGTNQ